MHLDFLFYFFIFNYKLCINGLLLLYITCRNETHEVIKYLEYCVHRLHNEDPGVHNLLLSLYAKQVDFLTLEFAFHSQFFFFWEECFMLFQ